MNATTTPQLYLTKQTFVCLTDNTLVFLDLKKDKYSCLEQRHTQAVSKLLDLPAAGANESTSDENLTAISKDTAEVVQDLIENDLATKNANQGKLAELIPAETELKEMLGYAPGEGPKINATHLFNFFKALIIAKFSRRLLPIGYTVNRIKRRKQKHYTIGSPNTNYERVNELVEVYKILKPLFVTVRDECLFNSLFLIEFLACYRVYPSWYFGVRLNEFYAHAWVQGDNIIYDDSVDNTCENQPIMSV